MTEVNIRLWLHGLVDLWPYRHSNNSLIVDIPCNRTAVQYTI
jgi:hypothetical protein